MKPFRKNSLEARALDLLRPFSLDDSTRYTLRAHELTRDGIGWSSNDRFTIATDADLAEALRAIRNRWETFRANYARKARVSDLEELDCFNTWNGEISTQWEAGCIAFLDLEISGPLVPLFDLIQDAETIDPAAIRADVEKARREFTEEEYPAETHAARLAALDQLDQ